MIGSNFSKRDGYALQRATTTTATLEFLNSMVSLLSDRIA